MEIRFQKGREKLPGKDGGKEARKGCLGKEAGKGGDKWSQDPSLLAQSSWSRRLKYRSLKETHN
jgi:hypothetical protein